jgi:hypothetical protein
MIEKLKTKEIKNPKYESNEINPNLFFINLLFMF